MNRLRKVIGNTVISLLGQAVTWTSTMTLTIAYGRFLGDVKLGELYFAMAFVALIGFPIDAGFNQQITRDVAQEPSKALQYVTNILCFKIILWVVLYGSILLLCWSLGYPPDPEIRTLVTICGITLLSSSLANIMSSLHYAFERVLFPVIGNILEKGLSALIGAILLYHGADVRIMAFVLLGSSCANMLWQSAWVLRLVGIPCTINIPLARKLLQKSIPFILYGILGVIYYRIDTVLLSFMASIEAIGWYGAAYRIFDTLVFLPSLVISAVMYPVFSRLTLHSDKELKIAVEKSLNFLLFCCIPISIGLIVAAPSLIGFLYHRSDFTNAIPAMQYLAPGLLFLYVNSVFAAVLVSTGREKKIPFMAGIALVFNLGLNLLLIPLYQHVGAALVTSLTELLLSIVSLIFVPRSLWPTGSIKVGLKALLAGLAMGTVVWFMQQYDLLLILLVATIVYFGAATLLGTIPREDMRVMYASIRHKAGRKKAGVDHAGITSEDIPFLTDEDMELEQEFVLALAREMTQPVLPAVKQMTNPVLPAVKRMTKPVLPIVEQTTHPILPIYKYEMTHPLLPIYNHREQIREEPTPSEIYEKQDDGKTRFPERRWRSMTDYDDDATIIRKVVRPIRNKNKRPLRD